MEKSQYIEFMDYSCDSSYIFGIKRPCFMDGGFNVQIKFLTNQSSGPFSATKAAPKAGYFRCYTNK